MKKVITAILALILLSSMTSAYAGEAGTSADPLISRSFAEGAYADGLAQRGEEQINAALTKAYDDAAAKLGVRGGRAPGYVCLLARAGSSLTMGMGCSVIVTAGSVSVTVDGGSVIDITTGEEVASGSALERGRRYFLTEDTTARFNANGMSALMVDGGYRSAGDVAPAFTKYRDVELASWYYDAAVFAHDKQLYPDYDANVFRPAEAATRAETIYALWTAVGRPASSGQNAFTDLTEDWYVTAVNWAVENGIVYGTSATQFSPNGTLDRQQMAAFIYRYTQSVGGDVSARADLKKFSDEKNIDAWSYENVSWANAIGILSGTSGTTMSPKDIASRSQWASVVMRYVK